VWSLTYLPANAGGISRADAARWIKHSATFSLIHPTCFALSAALFVALIAGEFSGTVRARRKLWWGAFAGFLVLVTCVALNDALRPLEPFMSEKANAAVDIERSLRAHADVVFQFHQNQLPQPIGVLPKAVETEDVKKVLGQAAAERVLAPDVLVAKAQELAELVKPENANYVAYLNILTNWVFGVLVASTALSIIILFMDTRADVIARAVPSFGNIRLVSSGDQFNGAWRKVLGMFIAILVWFPFRIYSTWYSSYYIPGDGGLGTYPAFVLLSIMATLFGVVLLLSRYDVWKVTVGFSVAVAGAIAAMKGLGIPFVVVLASIEHMLDAGWVFFACTMVAFFVFVAAVLVACFGARPDDEPTPPILRQP